MVRPLPEAELPNASASFDGCIAARSVASSCVPMTAATNEPALEPEITSGSRSCSSSAFVTPRWNGPSAPAPLSIKAERPKHRLARRKMASFSVSAITDSSTAAACSMASASSAM
jgi:hypothetical protein